MFCHISSVFQVVILSLRQVAPARVGCRRGLHSGKDKQIRRKAIRERPVFFHRNSRIRRLFCSKAPKVCNFIPKVFVSWRVLRTFVPRLRQVAGYEWWATSYKWWATSYKWWATSYKWWATSYEWWATSYEWWATSYKWWATSYKWWATSYKWAVLCTLNLKPWTLNLEPWTTNNKQPLRNRTHYINH